MSPIDTCGHLELAIGEEDVWHRVRELLQDPEVNSRHAETLTGQLELALSLSEEDDEVHPNSILVSAVNRGSTDRTPITMRGPS